MYTEKNLKKLTKGVKKHTHTHTPDCEGVI